MRLYTTTCHMSFVLSYIQKFGPDSVPWKHPHWAAGQKSVPSVRLAGWAVGPIQGVHSLYSQGNFSALPSLCSLRLLTLSKGMSALPLQNKGNRSLFHSEQNQTALQYTFYFSYSCSHLASKTLRPSSAALCLESTIQGPLVDPYHLTSDSTRLWFQPPPSPPLPL